jgi:anti-sigma factor RsiW
MNCTWMEKNLVAYLDGKADPGTRRKAEAHLASCAGCRERAEEFRALWSVLEEAPAVAPSASFDAAVRQRIAREPQRSGLWAWLTPSPRLALAVAAMLVLSIGLSSIRPGGTTAVVAPTTSAGEAEFSMIQNLPVLEDYDVLSSFDALSELPVQQAATPRANP